MRIETWTPERVSDLQRFIDEGLTFREIGGRLGLTKNQCLCKATRLGLRPVSAETLSKAQRSARYLTDRPDATSTIARLDALDVFPRFGHCVFPKGDTGTEGFHFCGSSLADPAAIYCPDHRRVAFTKGNEGWTEEKKAALRVKMAAVRAAKGAG